MTDYQTFLASKAARFQGVGFTPGDVNPLLHPWQARLVEWAARTGRAALWADTGLGKTFMQLEWARLSKGRTLIVAPLAGCQQTLREAAKLDIDLTYLRADDGRPGPIVTNYEMISRFDPAAFDTAVLDESSILKDVTAKSRELLVGWLEDVRWRLACTATPAPNDAAELCNHAEALGAATRREMLACYFIHDQDGWRPKGHAKAPMFRWMASWAAAVRTPSDLGYPDDGYVLPDLSIVPQVVDGGLPPDPGALFGTTLGGVSGRARVRRLTLTARVDRAVQLVYDCGPAGVQQGLLPSQQGQVGTLRGGPGAAERATAQALCGGSRTPREDEGPSGGLSAQAAIAAQGGTVRADSGRGRDDARPGLPDLRREPAHGLYLPTAHRPRPQDRHGPWCSLSAVQPGAGALGGRPDPGNGDVRLPHACRDKWLIWCGLNAEQDALADAFGDDCVSIDGRSSLEQKVELEREWREGNVRVLLTKPGIHAHGMNWQHCARMAFVGLSDSYEAYYQAIRRCWRYGQTRPVHAHVVVSDVEQGIAENVARKEAQARAFTAGLVEAMREGAEWSKAA